ncbi:MAG: ABC transporter substrate-binding protein [Candidatus Bipolaricaulia bacterium]
MNTRKNLAFIAVFLLVTSVFLAGISPAVSAQNKEVRIAVLQPRPQKGLYFYGTWAMQGFKIGLQYATDAPDWEGPYKMKDGRDIKIKIFDTEGSPEVGVSKARQAITNWGADILFGVSSSSVATSVEKIAETYETPYFISPAASASLTQKPKFNKYIFRIGRNSWHDAKTAAYYYGKIQGADTVGYLGIDYTFGHSGVKAAKSAFEDYGVESVATEFAPADTKNFKPYLERIKNKDPDILYIVWAGSGFAPLYKGINNMEMMDKVVGSVIDLFTMNRVNLLSGGLYEGAEGFCYFAYDVNSGPQYDFLVKTMKENDIRPDAFAAAFSQKEGDIFDKLSKASVPELWHGQAFATAQFIVEGLRRGSVSDPEGLIKAWEGMELQTPLGKTLIRPRDHQAVRPMFIAKAVKDKKENEIGTSDTVGLLIGKRLTKVPRKYIDPPIKTDYEPAEDE